MLARLESCMDSKLTGGEVVALLSRMDGTRHVPSPSCQQLEGRAAYQKKWGETRLTNLQDFERKRMPLNG